MLPNRDIGDVFLRGPWLDKETAVSQYVRPVACRAKSLTPIIVCLLALLLQPETASSQTTGIIQTKPLCFPNFGQFFGPPPFHTTVDEYIEGPDPVLLDNGDIAIFVDAGAGVFGTANTSEAIEALVYPASPASAPRWYPIYATNNWNTNTALKEAEGAYPVVRYFNRAWRTLYTGTLDYGSRAARCADPGQPPVPCSGNYDRTSRIDSLNPLWPPANRNEWWIQPNNVACRNSGVPPADPWGGTTWIQTCPGVGSGFPNALIGFDGNFYVYHADGNYSPCTFVRNQIMLDMTYGLPSCVAGAPGYVSDISTGNDGLYHMLGGPNPQMIGTDGFSEWLSADGLSWYVNPSRAPYTIPCQALGLDANCFVSGGAYLKKKTGRIVEPRLVVSGVGNRRCDIPPCDGHPLANDWRLYYWAEPNAPLPQSWGQTAASCPVPNLVPGGVPNYGGNFDGVGCEYIDGWAWDWYQPLLPVSVDVFADGVKLATISANLYRDSLAHTGDPNFYYGNGYHAFRYTLPSYLLDGNSHTINLRYAGTNQELSNSPRTFSCLAAFQGNHDGSSCYETDGWVWDSRQPHTSITADILVDGNLAQSVNANQFRGDLLNAGIGDGYHGFRWTTPGSVRDGLTHIITVRYGGTTIATSNSPRNLLCSSARFYTITPCRLVDTRNANGPYGGPAIGAQGARTFTLAGTCGIPNSASAVVLNVTVTGSTAGGSFTLYQSDLPVPTASSVAYSSGQTRADFGIFGLDSAGRLNVFCNQPSGTAHVILDATGYFQ
jgi:hypothetical protein